jgi:hypothetical protein
VTPTTASSRAGLATGGALALLLLTPLLGPGYVLSFDMVFVPHMPLTGRLLGLDGIPRAVPSDLFVALASKLVPGGWVQDVVLVGIVVFAAWGAARLVPSTRTTAAVVAATTYGWSAYLHERLLLGQWALLVGWAVLPWAARAALEWRRGGRGAPAVLLLAVAGCGGASSGLLVGLVVVLCGRPLRALLATAVFALPWALPALLLPGGQPGGDPAGVAAFASRSDTPFGLLVSLLTGGGVWAPAAVPPGRAASSIAALAVLALAAAGLPRLVRHLGAPLLVVGGAGLLMALLAHLPGVSGLLRRAVEDFAVLGLLRDGQKWVAPALLVVAVAAGCGAEALVERLRGGATRQVAWVLACLAPLAALPGAAWGEGGRLQVSTYPADWAAVTSRVDAPAVVVLPWATYRRFPWTGDHTVLDPAPRWVRPRAVVDDDLPLHGQVIQGEDQVAQRLAGAALSGQSLLEPLRAEHIGQVLVERTDRAAVPATLQRQVAGLELVVRTPELALYDVPGKAAAPARSPRLPVVVGDLLALSLFAWAALAVFTARRRRTSLP